jgi:hypothetical protein
VDGGAMATVYEGAEVHYTDTVTKGWLTVRYQVCAIDALGAASAYVVSSTRTVDNTSPPVIASGVSGDLGTKDDGFSWGYVVTQPDNTETTVTELIDGVVKRSYTASLGAQNTFEITRDAFKELLNGKHTMTVTAAAAGKSVSYSVTFTRATYTLTITLPEPLAANPAVPITKALVEVTRSIPADAAFKVLVTNNGLDANPVWEDATQSVLSGGKHLFSNTVLANAPAFNFLISASRGASNTGGSISAVAGAFE